MTAEDGIPGDDPVALAQRLVRVDTQNPPGGEEPLARLILRRLRAAGIRAALEPLGEGRANLLAAVGPPSGPHLLFAAHGDTVPVGELPWEHDPLSGDLLEGRLYGRGAADMKGGLAAMVVAIERLAREPRLGGRVSLLVSAGEEVDCVGARAFHARHGMGDVDALVVGEPTGMRVANAHKGALWVEVRCRGRTAHSALPREGVNAVEAVLDAATIIRSRPLPDEDTTLAITRLGGGVRTNVIPDAAFLEVDIRSGTQGGRELWERCEAEIARRRARDPAFRCTTRVLLERRPVFTAPSHPLIALALALTGAGAPVTVPYYTDASVLATDPVPTLILGPGDARQAHRPDEWVAAERLWEAADVYHRLALGYLGGQTPAREGGE